MGTGWLDVANGAFEKIQIGKSIELLVSTTSQFHLTFRDRGDTVELDGMLQKIPIVPAKQAAPAPWQPKLEKAVGEQGPDFSLHVEYNYARKDGRCVGLKSGIPIRFGKKWCLQGTSVFPATLWSLNKAETKSTK